MRSKCMRQDDALPPQLMIAATEWQVRIPTCDERCRREFVAWLIRDSRHVEAMLDLAAIERGIEGLSREAWQRLKDVLRGRQDVGPGRTPLWDRLADGLERALRSRLLGVFASFLGFVIAIQVVSQELAPEFQTQAGERRAVQLSDGSLMRLNTNSHVRIHYSSQLRAVHLLQGEALFAVAHDAERPFDVRTSDVVLRGTETEFNVHRDRNTTVSVISGRVQILEGVNRPVRSPFPSRLRVELSQGDEATLRSSATGTQIHVTRLDETDMSQ